MDRIAALLEKAHQKFYQYLMFQYEQAEVEERSKITEPDQIEGPALPPSMSRTRDSSPSSSSSERSPPHQRRQGRSPVREEHDRGRRRSYHERSPDWSPERKRRKLHSPEDGGRGSSPNRSPRRRRRDGRRGGSRYRDRRYDDGPRYDRYPNRSPSPERPSYRSEREERDKKYDVVKEEKPQRTILVKELPTDVSRAKIEEWFENAGVPIRDIQMIVDRNQRPKGLAFIELYQISAMETALALSRSDFYGKSIIIEKESFDPSAPAHSDGGRHYHQDKAKDPSLLRLYIGNLDYGINQEMLSNLLSEFGPIESLRLQTEPTGLSKGHAFVQFFKKEHALAAFYKLNQTTLAGRPLRCDFTKDARAKDSDLPPSPPFINPRATTTGQTHQHNGAHSTQNEGGYSLEDDLKINNQNMHVLMQRLAASGTSQASTSASVTQNQQIISVLPLITPTINKSSLPDPGVPTPCLILKNLFDPSTETNPNFDKEIEFDVGEEARSFGTLLHIFVDKTSFGDVYLKFKEIGAAKGCVELLHGRFYAERLVRAEYLPPSSYDQKFSL